MSLKGIVIKWENFKKFIIDINHSWNSTCAMLACHMIIKILLQYMAINIL